MSIFAFDSMNSIEHVINLALSICFNLYNILFGISFPFSLVFSISFFVGAENVRYFSVFCLRQINSPLNSFTSSVMIM